jgi:hypothetical protein
VVHKVGNGEPVKIGHRETAKRMLQQRARQLTKSQLREGESINGSCAVLTQNHAADLMGVHPHTAKKYLPAPGILPGTFIHITKRIPAVVVNVNQE